MVRNKETGQDFRGCVVVGCDKEKGEQDKDEIRHSPSTSGETRLLSTVDSDATRIIPVRHPLTLHATDSPFVTRLGELVPIPSTRIIKHQVKRWKRLRLPESLRLAILVASSFGEEGLIIGIVPGRLELKRSLRISNIGAS
nr:uncharacterized protein LOC124215624 [Neodiprion pinetum]